MRHQEPGFHVVLTPAVWSQLKLRGFKSHSELMVSVQFSRSVVSDSLRPHEPQHARPPCPSPTPRVHPNPCPSSWWCYPAISSSVVPFFSHLQSFPASGSFQMNQFFACGGQSTGVSASASVLPLNTQDWSPLGWTSWISVQAKGFHVVLTPCVWSQLKLRGFKSHSELMVSEVATEGKGSCCHFSLPQGYQGELILSTLSPSLPLRQLGGHLSEVPSDPPGPKPSSPSRTSSRSSLLWGPPLFGFHSAVLLWHSCACFSLLSSCVFDHLTSVRIHQGPLTSQSARSTPSPRMISFSVTFLGVIPPTRLCLQSGSLLHPDLCSHLPLGHFHLPISSLN